MLAAQCREIAGESLAFVGSAELVIHNAPFDTAFLSRELDLLDLKPISEYCANIVDTLQMARELHPGKKNNLNALCERYQIDNSARTLHGALLDANLLAAVYLAMTRGQDSLIMDIEPTPQAVNATRLAAGNQKRQIVPTSLSNTLRGSARFPKDHRTQTEARPNPDRSHPEPAPGKHPRCLMRTAPNHGRARP